MVAFLVAIRDVLLAAALAWVGVTLETRTNEQACSGASEVCERAR